MGCGDRLPLAPPIRSALIEAVERSELGYPLADTNELTTACAAFLSQSYGWKVSPARIFLVADVLAGT
jgi:bifunctional pyridoxal-dependent enzyme with beta-cystathionase and maltose regulon repressor activities